MVAKSSLELILEPTRVRGAFSVTGGSHYWIPTQLLIWGWGLWKDLVPAQSGARSSHGHLRLVHGKLLPNAVPEPERENEMRSGSHLF